jgi:uncharacterized membrane protein YfcA
MKLLAHKYFHPIIILLTIMIWTFYAIELDKLSLFLEDYLMSITMLFGSFIAGATSEGGGAVAFPVMTLIFKLSPKLARDYTFLIQSFGMTSASILILSKKIPIAKNVIPWVMLGSIIGCSLGLTFLEDIFAPQIIKLFFVTLWMCFGVRLLHNKDQTKKKNVSNQNLIMIGIIGGAITSLLGSGVDILTFSLLTLLFGYDEKILTPTSVIIMSLTSIFGVLFKIYILNDFSPKAYDFWWVTMPICIIGAPLGAFAISFINAKRIVQFLLLSILAQYVFALIILDISYLTMAISLSLVIALFIILKFKHKLLR